MRNETYMWIFLIFGSFFMGYTCPIGRIKDSPVSVQPAEVPEPWVSIQRGPSYSRKITCPLCDQEANIFFIGKDYKDAWSFGYSCRSGRHYSFYNDKMELQSAKP